MDIPQERKLVTEVPGPKSLALFERRAAAIPPGVANIHPIVTARASGAIVEDVDGNRFLDCAAGIAVNSTGHSHPQVVAAIVEQAQKFLHKSGTDFLEVMASATSGVIVSDIRMPGIDGLEL